MDPAIKTGFAIGFVIVALVVGVFGWRPDWLSGTKDGTASAPAALQAPMEPGRSASAAPGAAAPSAAPRSAEAAKLARPDERRPASDAPGDVASLTPFAPPPVAPPARPSVETGAFDIVRVEPSGEMVAAGRCAANCTVALTVDGRTHDTVKADGAGAWAMVPPPLPPGDHQLGLTVTTPDGRIATSEQSVTVSVPTAPSKEVVVLLNEPNAPSRVLQRPGPAATASNREAAAPGAQQTALMTPSQSVAALSIGAVDAEKGRLFVQGAGPAGATLRVYLNNALIAQPITGGDGRWSLKIERGLTPGDYAARVDQIDAATGKVVARVEARFVYGGELAAAAPAPSVASAAGQASADATGKALAEPTPGASVAVAGPPAPSAADGRSPAFVVSGRRQNAADAPGAAVASSAATPAASGAAPTPAADAANLVIAAIDTAKVERGDSLWRISRKTYGRGMRYTIIFSANDRQIRRPDLIYPGQVLVLPNDGVGSAAAR